ncbi:MFS transporter [Kordiimonas pumila]|uniref:MFS transporter n=1 Tax=Kordiimonas pumila TaxID=2161677 RepID=A0ABV7D659_9PROT|nr:aromatic acid/H+ symport family MFS transporter [Kordiimonas pumila]
MTLTKPTLQTTPAKDYGPLQLLVYCLCFLTMLIDGFDTQAISFAAPYIQKEFGGDHAALGLIFGAGLFGGLIGGFSLGPVGDYIGRKPLLIGSLTVIVVGSIITAYTSMPESMALIRFVTGIGLGGAIPSVIALSAEYAPPQKRSTIVAFVFSGFPIGAIVGAMIGSVIMPIWGWSMLFIVGGVAPMILLFAIVFFLPESINILKRKPNKELKLKHIQEKLGPWYNTISKPASEAPHGNSKVSITQLFTEGRAYGTLIIWGLCFLSLLTVYCIVSWLPTLINATGLPIETAVMTVGIMNIGSVFGNIFLARIADKRPPYNTTALFYGIGACFIATIELATTSSLLVFAIGLFAGVFSIGAQMSVTAIIARFYPATIRSTGVGWAFAAGRIGGVAGPVIAGFFLAAGVSFHSLMLIIASLSLMSGLLMWLLGKFAKNS